jgi:NAD(P)-dependent dehydrogenase (short-subunit alcohol dehydrogenase family)
MRLADKVAVITGAGSGIGRASAYLFAKEGAKVVVVDINDAGGKETVAAIEANGGEAIFVHTDVSVASEVKHLVKVTMDRFGKIDILFNNAGILIEPATVETTDESLWDRTYAVNVKGIFLGAKYAVPEMKKAGGGVIINTASDSGVSPLPRASAYASSKGAVITLTKALAVELAPDNIRVNCISPTRTETAMASSEERKKLMESLIPLGRSAKPEEIAYAALYLASDESSMLAGINLNVDGGRLA